MVEADDPWGHINPPKMITCPCCYGDEGFTMNTGDGREDCPICGGVGRIEEEPEEFYVASTETEEPEIEEPTINLDDILNYSGD